MKKLHTALSPSQSYNPEKYWTKRGKILSTENPYSNPDYKIQETKILNYLKNLQFSSVLEVGCGYGRITQLLLNNFKISKYLATDISSDLVKKTKENTSKFNNIEFKTTKIQELNFNRKFDLVIGVEVLQHIPPEEINSVIQKLVNLTKKHIINVDIQTTSKLAKHNFSHNYRTLYSNSKDVKSIDSFELDDINHFLFHAQI